jgi:hypothetical protein
VHYTISHAFIGISGIIIVSLQNIFSYKIEDLPVAAAACNNVYFGGSSHVEDDSQRRLRGVDNGELRKDVWCDGRFRARMNDDDDDDDIPLAFQGRWPYVAPPLVKPS